MSNQKQPFNKFKGYLATKGIKHKDVALAIGMSVVSFSQKINRSGSSFTLEEVGAICDLLDISADDFFLIKSFQKRDVLSLTS